eukprot:CAMPEP_0194039544 /NCGR_PEP_ID=MMETSP0009_2-20130614/11659_1 /TAXON_ID=210454 /ORGANISM="Grammatophora oceanica, Strain CCMP 410" /LENGTH=817 /DNA_ID=CAMNT_0038682411 /DNA_START=94 /DNA_END=2547 /DNA_ORIENTATION=+
MSDEAPTSAPTVTVTTWSPVTATLVVAALQGIVFLAFFLWKRGKDQRANSYELFEPRQFTRSHRSPPPFDGRGCFGWFTAAYAVSQEDCLNFAGLDAYMFLRFLRLGTRMAFVGTCMSLVLLPLYATGEATGLETEQFNLLTMARLEQASMRLWVPTVLWWIFILIILKELWQEWQAYGEHRYRYLAKGDVDTPPEYRYAVRVENVPPTLRSTPQLRSYFERLFPNQVRDVSVCMYTKALDKLIAERQKNIEALEKAVAFTNAKPDKPAPKTSTSMVPCCGPKVEAIPYHRSEIARLNDEIDTAREAVLSEASAQVATDTDVPEEAVEYPNDNASNEQEVELVAKDYDNLGTNVVVEGGTDDVAEATADNGSASSTGYVTFTSLKAKQAAVQCEISGKKDRVDVFAASEPNGVIWDNVTTPLTQQRVVEMVMAAFWMVGVLFWAVPVAFVTALANLNGLLKSVGLPEQDPNSAWYGIVSGLLPVIFLQILMIVLYLCIVACAKMIIKKKSMPEVDTYALFWHQLFQFANLWLILFGGSAISELDTLLNNPDELVRSIAAALPAQSVFFVNYIILASFGAFGLELSMLPTYGVKLLLSMIQPEASKTQRQLDDEQVPPSVIWGRIIPPMIFIWLVSIVYMTIVPMMSVFALVFFSGAYIVWKHQCLHVYASEFEGGGTVTWQTVFVFLLASLYMAELIWVGYMGLKEAPAQAACGFIPFGFTILTHMLINRNIRKPLESLSLEVAALVDQEDGEMTVESASYLIDNQLYGQPSLKTVNEERGAMPYRRSMRDMEYKSSTHAPAHPDNDGEEYDFGDDV